MIVELGEYLRFLTANIDYMILAALLFVFFILLVRKILRSISTRHKARIERLISEYEDYPYDFEKFVAALYERRGFKTELTAKSGDRGKDIVMYKGRRKYAVEVKLYKPAHKVDRERIQKLHSAMIDCEADEGIFVTTSDYTEPAYEYAEKHNIRTVNGEELSSMIKVGQFKYIKAHFS